MNYLGEHFRTGKKKESYIFEDDIEVVKEKPALKKRKKSEKQRGRE